MKFTEYFRKNFEDLSLQHWSEEEKVALMKVIHAIYVADHDFASLEQADYNEKLAELNIQDSELDNMNLHQALGILERDKFKHELAYSLIADALFKDDSYNDIEAAFIDYLETHHAISKEKLDRHIETARKEKLDTILSNWVKQIKATKL